MAGRGSVWPCACGRWLPDSTQGRQPPVPLDRLPPAPAGSADDEPGTARRAVAAMVRELNDLLAPVISQLEALRQAESTSDSLWRSREPARLRIVGDLHAWCSCPGLYRRTVLSGPSGSAPGFRRLPFAVSEQAGGGAVEEVEASGVPSAPHETSG